MKLLFALVSVAAAVIGSDITAHQSAIISALDLHPALPLPLLPILAAAACFLVLASRFPKDQSAALWSFIRRYAIIQRIILGSAAAFVLVAAIDLLLGKRAASLAVLPLLGLSLALSALTVRAERPEVRSALQCVRSTHLLARSIFAATLLMGAWAGSHFYFHGHVAQVPVRGATFKGVDRQDLEASLGFKIVEFSNSRGVTLCFANEPGRAQRVESLVSGRQGAKE